MPSPCSIPYPSFQLEGAMAEEGQLSGCLGDMMTSWEAVLVSLPGAEIKHHDKRNSREKGFISAHS